MDTKGIITNAALELFRHNSIDKVSVQQILDAAHVSRSTFYRHFLDKQDIITWYCEKSTEVIVRSMAGKRWKEIYIAQNTFTYNNFEFFKVLFQKETTNSLEKFIAKNNFRQLLSAYLEGSGKSEAEPEILLALDFTVQGLGQVIRRWVMNGCPGDPVNFSNTSFEFIPSCLREYL